MKILSILFLSIPARAVGTISPSMRARAGYMLDNLKYWWWAAR